MFVGRKMELQRLNRLLEKNTSSLIAVTGRRRIGKSRLLQEFSKSFEQSYVFSGLAPAPGVSAQSQKQEFKRLLAQHFHWPEFVADDWGELFSLLAQQCQTGRTIIVFDEVSWMAHGDKLFLSKLKNAWDLEFKNNPHLVLALCGSLSSWIEENILSSTGFVGRVSETVKLKELQIPDAVKFWGEHGSRVSGFEKLRVLNVIGGVPRYLEEIVPAESAEQNICNTCFSPSGILFSEFDRLFSDLFLDKKPAYYEIILALSEGHAAQAELADRMGKEQGGTLSGYLNELEQLGFITRDFSWSLHSQKQTRISRFRLSDNYSRFFVKYIKPNKSRIESATFPDKGMSFLKNWESIMGLQFENLILNNRKLILDHLHIDPLDVLADGPYYQTQTKKHAGCQIDYLIQTRFKSLYVCEMKFRNDPIGLGIVSEMEAKLKALQIPKNYSIRPVLITAGEVSQQLIESRYFDSIISLASLLS